MIYRTILFSTKKENQTNYNNTSPRSCTTPQRAGADLAQCICLRAAQLDMFHWTSLVFYRFNMSCRTFRRNSTTKSKQSITLTLKSNKWSPLPPMYVKVHGKNKRPGRRRVWNVISNAHGQLTTNTANPTQPAIVEQKKGEQWCTCRHRVKPPTLPPCRVPPPNCDPTPLYEHATKWNTISVCYWYKVVKPLHNPILECPKRVALSHALPILATEISM